MCQKCARHCVRQCVINVSGNVSCVITVSGNVSYVINMSGNVSCVITLRQCVITVSCNVSCVNTVSGNQVCVHSPQCVRLCQKASKRLGHSLNRVVYAVDIVWSFTKHEQQHFGISVISKHQHQDSGHHPLAESISVECRLCYLLVYPDHRLWPCLFFHSALWHHASVRNFLCWDIEHHRMPSLEYTPIEFIDRRHIKGFVWRGVFW